MTATRGVVGAVMRRMRGRLCLTMKRCKWTATNHQWPSGRVIHIVMSQKLNCLKQLPLSTTAFKWMRSLGFLPQGDYFLRVLMFDISVDPKMQSFIIGFSYYRTLEIIDPLPLSVYKSQILVHVKCALNQNHRRMYLQIIVTLS